MTDCAVVVIGFLIIRPHKIESVMRLCPKGLIIGPGKAGDRVLMFVVREFDRELPFLLWFQRQLRSIGLAKCEARVCARRGAKVADGANRRSGSDHRLSCKKLLTMTTDAGVVIGKVGDVREIALRVPCRWNLVTSIAREALMFV